jgi:outer membrane immunogenic protein
MVERAMKFQLVGTTAVLLVVTLATAQGADMPAHLPPKAPVVAPVPYFSWTGFYLGFNGGGGWGRSSHADTNFGLVTPNFDLSGGLLGGTAGYNYQAGNAVLGLEGDLDWAKISGTTTTFVPGVNYSSYLQWLGTVRGRVGLAFDRFLPYVTGGLAVGNVKGTISGPGTALSGTSTDAGWTVGAGLEYGITPSLSVKAEYLYLDLAAATPVPGDTVDIKSHVVRGGLNWRFNWDGPPRY